MEDIRLRSGVDFFESSTSKCLIINPVFGASTYRVMKPYDQALQILLDLTTPISPKLLEERYRDENPKDYDAFLSFLISNKLLRVDSKHETLDPPCKVKYARQMAYFEQSDIYHDTSDVCQALLEKSRVVIIGCGGAGAPVAELLAGSGIGCITIIDNDTVELSNLGRQIAYSESDVGKPKVKCLASRLHQIKADLTINTVVSFLVQENAVSLLRNNDFIVVAADEPLPDLLYWVDTVSKHEQIPYACISNCPPTIRIGPIFDPNEAYGYRQYEQELERRWPEVKNYEAIANLFEYNKATTVCACYSSASLLVGQIIQKLLTGTSALDGRSFLLNLETLEGHIGVVL